MIGHITQKQWDAHPSFRQELKAMLQSETFRAALQILIAKGFEVKPLIGGMPCDLVQYSALIGQRKEGYFDCLTNLEQLTEGAVATPQNLKSWYNPERDKPPQPVETKQPETPAPPAHQ